MHIYIIHYPSFKPFITLSHILFSSVTGLKIHIVSNCVRTPERNLECWVNLTDVNQSRVDELDSVQVSCRVTFVSYLQPVFRCQPEAVQPPRQSIEITKVSHLLGEVNVTSPLVTFIHDHVITVTRQQNGVPLTCTMEMTSYSIPGVKPAVYSSTWTSSPLVVICEFVFRVT